MQDPRETMRLTPITSFRGPYFFLSNFFPTPVEWEGLTYPTAEHAYQAAKSSEKHVREAIVNITSPVDAKNTGQCLDLRKDWTRELSLQVMEEVVRAKFLGNDDIARRLLNTSPSQLIEGNTWGDVFWGQCAGEGDNHLGKILMKIRVETRQRLQN